MKRVQLLLVLALSSPLGVAQVKDASGGRLSCGQWGAYTDDERRAYLRGAADVMVRWKAEDYSKQFPHGGYKDIAARVAPIRTPACLSRSVWNFSQRNRRSRDRHAA